MTICASCVNDELSLFDNSFCQNSWQNWRYTSSNVDVKSKSTICGQLLNKPGGLVWNWLKNNAPKQPIVWLVWNDRSLLTKVMQQRKVNNNYITCGKITGETARKTERKWKTDFHLVEIFSEQFYIFDSCHMILMLSWKTIVFRKKENSCYSDIHKQVKFTLFPNSC